MKQNVFVRICRWLLGLLGFGASVSGCNIIPIPVMYGSPSMTFSVRGKVVDGSGKPIEGIQVASDPETGPFSDDRTFSDADGGFVFGPYSDIPFDSIDLWFDDVDLEQHGGYFARQKVSFALHQVKKGHGSWDQGTYENDSDFVLTMIPDTGGHDWYATMRISGYVYDAALANGPKALIKGGIKVELENGEASCTVGQESRFSLEYVVTGKDIPATVKARFTDCDGTANGSYRDTTITFTMTKAREGIEYWDLGTWYNENNSGVYLKKKN